MNAQKRKISQNDLRLLMMEKKRKLSEMKKKIDSPLAKYLSDGTLMCIICNSPVKNETLWPVHINAKQHRDNIAKKRAAQKETQQPVAVSNVSAKVISKEPIPVTTPVEPMKVKGILKNKQTEYVNQTPSYSSSFQNTSSNDTSCQMEVDVEPDSGPANEIPEGFFDDPIQDAKARNIDYKDPIEEEWERFKKEIQEENAVSEQIAEEDQDQALVDREIEIIDENMYNWSRVRELEVQLEKVQQEKSARKNVVNQSTKDDSDHDSSYGSEEEFDEYIDWRSKRSFK
ncbi:zinc finger protein 830 [Planococcus citri]|uniref:zinc finger protein 830 n=1 Tax=Planococcus citri TaxID=170843 RepID=UPI0031FA3BE3